MAMIPGFNYNATMTPGGLGDALAKLGGTVATANAQRRQAEMHQQGLAAQMAMMQSRNQTNLAWRQEQMEHEKRMEAIAARKAAPGTTPLDQAKLDNLGASTAHLRSLVVNPNVPSASQLATAGHAQSTAEKAELENAKQGGRPVDIYAGKRAHDEALAEQGFVKGPDGTWARPQPAPEPQSGVLPGGAPSQGFGGGPPPPPGVQGGPQPVNGVVPGIPVNQGTIPAGDGVQNNGAGGAGNAPMPSGGPGTTAVLPTPPPQQSMAPAPAQGGLSAALAPPASPFAAPPAPSSPMFAAPAPVAAPAPAAPAPPPFAGVQDRAKFTAKYGADAPAKEIQARQQGYTFSDDAPPPVPGATQAGGAGLAPPAPPQQ